MSGYKYLMGFAVSIFVYAQSSYALEVNIDENRPYVTTVHDGVEIKIERIQDQNHMLTGAYAKTSRKCPPFCIQPIEAAPGVKTVGELELLDFIEQKLNKGTGILIDSRTSSWFKQGTIPGSINVPFNTFSPESSDLVKASALSKFGVTRKDETSVSLLESFQRMVLNKHDASAQWDFSLAKELLLWCNGNWCGQSPHAIHGLLELGYPAEKIYYYRGGMQSWLTLGFDVVKPNE
ncbi:MAG TPA: rhodanese-like domain-containing protein [Gammaproteobacteria bacterium]